MIREMHAARATPEQPFNERAALQPWTAAPRIASRGMRVTRATRQQPVAERDAMNPWSAALHIARRGMRATRATRPQPLAERADRRILLRDGMVVSQ